MKVRTKTCSKCEEELLLDDFYKHKYSKFGRSSQCKICVNKARRGIYANKKSGTYISRVRKPRLNEKDRQKIKEDRYPDSYTVLCFNCNCAKGAFGFCPHKLKNKESLKQ